MKDVSIFIGALPALREKKHRLRTIFKKLRRTDRYFGLSDFCLLKTIILSLDELGLPYSRAEVREAFKEIDPDDYDLRKPALGDLARNSVRTSVFPYQITARTEQNLALETRERSEWYKQTSWEFRPAVI